LRGGLPGALGEYTLARSDGSAERLPPKCTIPLARGDRLVIRTPGGGGYGDPFERSAESVLRDVSDGLVSGEVAERDYGVVIDAESMQISREETAQRRERMQ
jgi:N-methylhydantoinase B